MDEIKQLSVEETDGLLQTIEENDFWNIPTIHPEETLGCDGSTLFIEGYENGEEHFISMWESSEEYEITKIFRAFSSFADTIAEKPQITWDEINAIEMKALDERKSENVE